MSLRPAEAWGQLQGQQEWNLCVTVEPSGRAQHFMWLHVCTRQTCLFRQTGHDDDEITVDTVTVWLRFCKNKVFFVDKLSCVTSAWHLSSLLSPVFTAFSLIKKSGSDHLCIAPPCAPCTCVICLSVSWGCLLFYLSVISSQIEAANQHCLVLELRWPSLARAVFLSLHPLLSGGGFVTTAQCSAHLAVLPPKLKMGQIAMVTSQGSALLKHTQAYKREKKTATSCC